MPTKGGLGNALREGKAIGCTAVQVFTSSPQMWRASAVTDDKIADFQKAKTETGIDVVVSHDSYLINLCSPAAEMREKSIAGMIGEIGRCASYGIKFVVSHLGAHMGQGEDVGLACIGESLKEVLKSTPNEVTICMETTAGQGSSLMSKFEHFETLLTMCGGDKRLGVCLDTCHIFVAGYDIRDKRTYEDSFEKFDKIVGLDRLKAIHCNDSKKGLGSRVDRHADIGVGEIGEEAFRQLVNDKRFANVPILLETPTENDGHKRNLAHLKSLIK